MYLIRFPKNIKKKLKTLNTMAEENEAFVHRVQEAVAKEYKKQLLRHIENQDRHWKELTIPYAKYKAKKGLSPKIWKATGQLKKSIKIIERPDGSYFVGIDANEKYPDGTSVALVAMVHEYGSPTMNIPARPLFRPTRQKMLANINNYVKTENEKHVKYLVRKINLGK